MKLYFLLGGWAGDVVARKKNRINKTIQVGKLILKKFLSSMYMLVIKVVSRD